MEPAPCCRRKAPGMMKRGSAPRECWPLYLQAVGEGCVPSFPQAHRVHFLDNLEGWSRALATPTLVRAGPALWLGNDTSGHPGVQLTQLRVWQGGHRWTNLGDPCWKEAHLGGDGQGRLLTGDRAEGSGRQSKGCVWEAVLTVVPGLPEARVTAVRTKPKNQPPTRVLLSWSWTEVGCKHCQWKLRPCSPVLTLWPGKGPSCLHWVLSPVGRYPRLTGVGS